MTSTSDRLKHFAMTSQLIEHDLGRIEDELALDLGRSHSASVDAVATYYPQIEQDIRAEAARMAPHYEMFYSLERSIRRMIAETIAASDGPNWWAGKRVGAPLKQTIAERQQKELDSGVTPRSDEPIDFTTFGELGELIKQNWDLFGAIFSSVKAVQKVMASLNTLRGPIAHCTPLADDEVVRLQLSVRDWFRLMQ